MISSTLRKSVKKAIQAKRKRSRWSTALSIINAPDIGPIADLITDLVSCFGFYSVIGLLIIR